MKKLLLTLVLLGSATLFAQSPFDGTWMTKLDTAKFPTKPDQYSLKDDMYECLTCVPKLAVKADGTDQKVTGHPYYDTVAVRVLPASVALMTSGFGATNGILDTHKILLPTSGSGGECSASRVAHMIATMLPAAPITCGMA